MVLVKKSICGLKNHFLMAAPYRACGLRPPVRANKVPSGHFLDGAATLPFPRRGLRSPRFSLNSGSSGGLKLDCLRCPVQSEISDFGFEMQDSSNFEMFSFD